MAAGLGLGDTRIAVVDSFQLGRRVEGRLLLVVVAVVKRKSHASVEAASYWLDTVLAPLALALEVQHVLESNRGSVADTHAHMVVAGYTDSFIYNWLA
jgi:hypothetical protein